MAKPRRIPNGVKNVVGAKVMQVRKEKGIRQKELSDMLESKGMKLCPSSVSKLEGQHRIVKRAEVAILAEVLGVSEEWLLSEDDKQ